MTTTEERLEILEKQVRTRDGWIKVLGWALVVMFFVGSYIVLYWMFQYGDLENERLQALRLLEEQRLLNEQR